MLLSMSRLTEDRVVVPRSGWAFAVFVAGAALAAFDLAVLAGVASLGGPAADAMLHGFVLLVLGGLVAVFAFRAAAGAARRDGGMAARLDAVVPDPHVVLDRNGDAVFMNRSFATRFGMAEAGSGRGAIERLRAAVAADEASSAEFARFEAAAAAGRELVAELRLRGEDGRTQYVEASVLPLPAADGHVLWRFVDVTDRRQMLDIIRDEQRKLVDFLDNAPLGFYSADEAGRFLFVNHTFAAWLGCPADELIEGERRLHDFVVDRDPAAPPHGPFACSADEAAGEVTLRTLAGRGLHVHIRQSTVRDAETDGLRTRSIVRDLTAEREWERALRLSEQRFERFFEEAPLGVCLLDGDCRMTEANPAFAVLVATQGASLLGRRFTDLLRPDDRADVQDRLARVAAGEAAPMPLGVVLDGPGDRSCAVFARPLDVASGPPGLMLHLIDTTQQKKLELQFAQSQKMLAVGQLAGGIAHDFNNLLTAMIGFSDLLLMRHSPGDPSFADIQQIRQNANRAANLVRQLLAFSRQQTLQPRIINLTDVLADLSNLLRRLLGANVELRLEHARDLHLVKVDQVQMEQVVMNLAVNARDAMPDGGTVTVRTRNVVVDGRRGVTGHEPPVPGDYVLIEVVDTGTGIAPEHIDRVFEPFFSTKAVGSGTGLGLSTVYGIVKQTDGYIFVDSAPGRGATFAIYLPRFQETARTETAGLGDVAHTPADLTGAGTILLVEDEDPVRLFSARALRNKGYKVIEARSGDAALDLIEADEQPIDLLITDVVMPHMDGPTLIAKVREGRPAMRVICISGYAEGSFRQKLAGLADVHFLPKPFSLQQLAGKVKEVIAAR